MSNLTLKVLPFFFQIKIVLLLCAKLLWEGVDDYWLSLYDDDLDNVMCISGLKQFISLLT